ncbi:PREDICTED: serine/threonine-protein phosphatase 4 regulatory subunit 2-like, partial [Vollenhovia emeryi]|uniref:serine/threonine-protein phosphatase 4 regulatory subunit 2-like n=1 Tax=Vollenhovia emeryi TaxID=411798 RepID=UPI0005F3C059
IIIPPNLLQIINNLAGDYDYDEICQEKNSGTDFHEVLTDETRGNNSNPEGDQDSLSYDEDSNEEDEEDNFEEEDDDSDKDIDETYNELESDDLINETEKQMETRGQKSSIINSRDQIFMRKENYLYLLTKDGKPCDEGSKQLKKRNLIPKIKENQVGNFKRNHGASTKVPVFDTEHFGASCEVVLRSAQETRYILQTASHVRRADHPS